MVRKKKKINDILLSNQWGTNGVRPYAESLDLFSADQTDSSTAVWKIQIFAELKEGLKNKESSMMKWILSVHDY